MVLAFFYVFFSLNSTITYSRIQWGEHTGLLILTLLTVGSSLLTQIGGVSMNKSKAAGDKSVWLAYSLGSESMNRLFVCVCQTIILDNFFILVFAYNCTYE